MSHHAISLNHETLGSPENPAVLLIHGLFGDLDNLKSISRALSDAYYVINIDLRNHGQSPWVSSMSFPEMAADVLALLDTLEIQQAHILGHSLGGKVAMEVAMHHPERIRSLVVADIAPVRYPPSHNTILAALTALPLNQVKNRQDADARLARDIKIKGVRQFLLKNLTKTDEGWAWRMNLADINACYPELIGAPGSNKVYEGPTLFIRGGLSDYIQAKHKTEILARFPNAQSKTMSGVGHWLHAEKPLIFNGLVQRFLDEN
ncbi:alpha/beta hydrolase [Aliidiomarina taiwanensis]|uniref:Alpha/beta hydrolase n=1 Tax=Aliidiomarina taiwanensis TaxID=946228 RepID=A0A432XAR4_9GAMM|nr:alpha/beta fold hydrolase [Aliidiomarina taiwanensis]RUO44331.1 alpha/beta hydrolase [Aliidiomarina taiwanensis]